MAASANALLKERVATIKPLKLIVALTNFALLPFAFTGSLYNPLLNNSHPLRLLLMKCLKMMKTVVGITTTLPICINFMYMPHDFEQG